MSLHSGARIIDTPSQGVVDLYHKGVDGLED